jgi:hypothetical protein
MGVRFESHAAHQTPQESRLNQPLFIHTDKSA